MARALIVVLSILVSAATASAREPLRDLEFQRQTASDPAERQRLDDEIRAAREELRSGVERGSVSELRRELAAGLDLANPQNRDLFKTAVCSKQVRAVEVFLNESFRPEALTHTPGVWDCVASLDDPRLATAMLGTDPPPNGWTHEMMRAAIESRSVALLARRPDDAFDVAIRLGKTGLARTMLAGHQNPQWLAKRSLEEATRSGEKNVIETVLEVGGDWLGPEEIGEHMTEAVRTLNLEMVRFWVDVGARPSSQALREAAKIDAPEVFQELVRGGVDPGLAIKVAFDHGARSSLQVLVSEHLSGSEGAYLLSSREVARRLLEAGIDREHSPVLMAGGSLDVDARDGEGRTGLLRAAEANHVRLAELYLDAEADPEAADPEGKTALWWAANHRQLPLMQRLRSIGVSEAEGDESPSEAFWKSFSWHEYRNLVDGRIGVVFTLPEVFLSSCSGEEVGTDLRYTCDSTIDFEVEITAGPSPTAGLFAGLFGGSDDDWEHEKEPLETIGDQARATVAGTKGSRRFEVTALGPAKLALEVEALAWKTWERAIWIEKGGGFLSPRNILLGLLALGLVAFLALRLRG